MNQVQPQPTMYIFFQQNQRQPQTNDFSNNQQATDIVYFSPKQQWLKKTVVAKVILQRKHG